MAGDPEAPERPAWLPEAPSEDLDPALDAVAACIARHGMKRTTMTDVANEMGVSRPTVYKQIGSVDNAIWLIISRDVVRFFTQVVPPEVLVDPPDATVRVMEAFVLGLREHPVGGRIIKDEPEFLGRLLTSNPSEWFDNACEIIVPYLGMAIDAGLLRKQDPKLLAQWLIRVCFVMAVAPPKDLKAMLRATLLPVLTP